MIDSYRLVGIFEGGGTVTSYHRGEETRARILEAATEAFARYGYDSASVAEICRRAGVTKGGFYHHFPSKQALFLEMLERWLGGIDDQLELARSGAGDVPGQLLSMSAMIRLVFQEAGGRLPLFLEFLNKAGHSPVVWQATVAPFRRYHDYFAAMVESGVKEGSLRSVDPDLASNVLMSYAVGLLVLGLLDPHGADWGLVGQGGMQILLEGLGKG
jgi:AcrR family transcriptional regulator